MLWNMQKSLTLNSLVLLAYFIFLFNNYFANHRIALNFERLLLLLFNKFSS